MRAFRIKFTLLSRLFLIWILMFLCMSGCNFRAVINDDYATYECFLISDFGERLHLNLDTLEEDSLLSRYSENSLIVANAYGLIPDLKDLERINNQIKENGVNDTLLLKLILTENQIDETLDLAYLELSAVEDYLDCATIKLKKIRDELQNENNKAQNLLTNSAIILGAAVAAFTAGVLVSDNQELKDADAIDWIGVAGGVAAAYLAYRSTRVDKRMLVAHPQNYIRAIWTGKDSLNIFPSSSWYLLNQGFPYEDETISYRKGIIDMWNESSNMLGKESNLKHLSTILEDRGEYNLEMIQLRIDMLEVMGLGVDLLLKDLYQINMERY